MLKKNLIDTSGVAKKLFRVVSPTRLEWPMVRDCVGESDLGSWDVVRSGENGGKRGREWLKVLAGNTVHSTVF
nr:hypothetical protein [Tanacetum cinerariifolium]